MKDSLSNECSSKAHIQYEGTLLMKQEGIPLNSIQEPLVALDKELNNIQNEIDEAIETLGHVLDNYNDFNTFNMAFNAELKNIATVNKATVINAPDKQSIIDKLEQLKKNSESMKRIKKNADGVSHKGNEIVKSFRKYNPLDCENLLEIIKQNNEAFKLNLDQLIDNSNALNHKLALYKQIEELGRDIIAWLETTNDQFNRVFDNPCETEHKITNYENELPNQLNSKRNFHDLMCEYKQMNNDSLPQSLEAMDANIETMFAAVQLHFEKLNSKMHEYNETEKDLKDRDRKSVV